MTGSLKPMVLDYSRYEIPSIEVVLPDDTRLELFEPTKDLYEVMVAYEEDRSGFVDKITSLQVLVSAILSNNTEGEFYMPSDVESMLPVSLCHDLVARYWDFTIQQVLKVKNS